MNKDETLKELIKINTQNNIDHETLYWRTMLYWNTNKYSNLEVTIHTVAYINLQ